MYQGLSEDPEDQKEIVAQIRDVFLGIGFVAVANHTLSPQFVSTFLQSANQLIGIFVNAQDETIKIEINLQIQAG